jgi:hypothetical protein
MTRLALEQDGEEWSRNNGGSTRIMRKKLHRDSAEAKGEGVAATQSEGVYQAGGIASWEVPPCLLVCIRHTVFAQRWPPTSVGGGVAAMLWI